jgi:nicotinamidase-related amidase
MKIPQTNRKRALIVVDLQPAFIKPHNDHIVTKVAELIKQVPYDAYVEAVWHGEADSLWNVMMKVERPLDETTHTVDEVRLLLESRHPLQVLKSSRSVFKGDQDVSAYLSERGIKEVHIVGTETNDCVLATAHSAFDEGFVPYVIEECCESGYVGRHEEGVRLLRYQKLTNNSCLAETVEVKI